MSQAPTNSDARRDAEQSPTLLIVIVNFRTPDLTLDCLRSLAPEMADLPGARAVVVENGSGDDSAARLTTAFDAEPDWQAWLTLQVEPRNWGFAGGNNRAIERYPGASYVLLLNSDTIVHPGCMRRCFDKMEREPDIGALSCRVLNPDGSMQNVARRIATPARLAAQAAGLPWSLPRWFGWANLEDPGWDRTAVARDVEWVSGAFMWIRGDALRAVGALDEEFFFEGEDMEYCLRLRRAGWRVHYDPAGAIVHLGGSSSDPTRMERRSRSKHRWRARYLFLRKGYGRPAAWLQRVIDVAWCAAHLARLRLRGRGRSDAAENLRAVLATLLRPLS